MSKSAQDPGYLPKGRYAFTLVELLIVVALISIMTGIMLPGFSTYIEEQNIKQAQEQIKNDLRMAQNKALTGVRATEVGVEYWGIRFDDDVDRYTTFSSPVNNDCATLNNSRTSEKLIGDSVIRNGAKCILFGINTGDTFFIDGISGVPVSCDEGDDNSCMVSVGPPGASGAECKGVKVNALGLIRKVENVQCE